MLYYMWVQIGPIALSARENGPLESNIHLHEQGQVITHDFERLYICCRALTVLHVPVEASIVKSSLACGSTITK